MVNKTLTEAELFDNLLSWDSKIKLAQRGIQKIEAWQHKVTKSLNDTVSKDNFLVQIHSTIGKHSLYNGNCNSKQL